MENIDFGWAKSYNFTDGENDLQLFVTNSIANLTYPYYLPELTAGDYVMVEGAITVYGTAVEIIPTSASAIQVLENAYEDW